MLALGYGEYGEVTLSTFRRWVLITTLNSLVNQGGDWGFLVRTYDEFHSGLLTTPQVTATVALEYGGKHHRAWYTSFAR